ncbi:MAG: cation:proton antiporter [Candidatus Verstraetearchaeota archaeon]|nr:cation:proton antiporter [Candidatus Verstraetearchaeota archaeon]
MFGASYLLHFLLDRFHLPSLLAPLLVGLVFRLVPQFSWVGKYASSGELGFLSSLGIMLLMFLVGVRVDVNEFKRQSLNMVSIAILNILFSTLIGMLVLLYYGYPLLISALISSALATVAEATIAPILDELDVIRSRSANLILGPGILDDVLEIATASIASVMVGSMGTFNPSMILLGIFVLLILAIIFHRLILPKLASLEVEARAYSLTMLMIVVALTFTLISEYFSLGILLGAVTAGIVFQKFISKSGGECVKLLRALAYGFLGPIFFFTIGLSITPESIVKSAMLTLWLVLANFAGKFASTIIVGVYAKMNWKEIVVVGMGLSAKFSMGIIPAQILYSAGLIDEALFTSFVGVSTITTMTIPFTLSYIVKRWREDIINP